HTPTRNLRACQCFNESEIPDPAADFKGRYIDNLPASGVNKPGHQQSADVQQEFALQVSQHAVHSSNYRFYVLPPFEAESLLDPNSYFNNVVDEDFQWIIFDIGSHKHISLLKLFINRMDLSAMRFLEVFVRGAPLPHWLVETDFRSSDGEKGRRTEYFRRATMAEKMLWWHCEDLKFHHGVSYIYSECCPHQRTRWVMIRMKVNSDLLEMKYMMGFDWLKFPEISRILVTNLQGQPQEPPVFTQTHPQFTLPLTTHDSVHPDERFLQEDWDVEACGDWEIMKDTTIVGVPSKLKLTISEEHREGKAATSGKKPGPIKDSSCKRAVYFRVDNDTGVPAANRTTKPRSVPPRADPGSAASSIPHHIAAILGGSSAAKSKPRNAAQKQRQQVGPSQVSDPQPAAPAAAPQAVTSSAAEELPASVGLRLGAAAARRPPAATTGLALLDQLLIQHHQHQVLQLLQSQHQSGFPLGTTGNPLAYGFWMPTDEGVLAAAAAAASTEPSAPAADEPKDSAVKLVDEDAMEAGDEENSMEDDEAEDEEDRSSSANCSAGPHSAGSDGGEDATGKY
uniref:HSF_DOMAIN domain-containing protein n=1 Tax=Macrostomum lignano TaxID=282301 RepID=A0A1I8FMN9_9PLAT